MTQVAIIHSLVVVIVMEAAMIFAWRYQRAVGNAGWIDVFWTFGTGAACVTAALFPMAEANPGRQALLAGLTALWSLRLGTYLSRRVGGSREDVRYVELRRRWGARFDARLLRFVMWQPPVSAALALSVFAAAHLPGPLGWRDLAGLAVFAIAIAGESLADEQMRRYKLRKNRPPVMDGGLWGRSRHPNYFFEWLFWIACPVIGFVPTAIGGWLTLLAPAIMYVVLRHATGVPILEASMLERKGDAFRDYRERVNAFFPSLRNPASATPGRQKKEAAR